MKITNLIKSLFLVTIVLSSCTKEDMIGPNIEITTTLDVDDVAYADEPFVIRFARDKADFYSVYMGRDAANTYGVPGATGIYLNSATDSIQITYPTVGQYMLTIVASSTGNQGADFATKVDSFLVTVYDRRATLAVFNYYTTPTPVLVGTIDGTVITADYVDAPGANYLFKPTFITSSPNAKVYINEVKDENLQTSGQHEYDFSNADLVPLKYIVVSPTGLKTEYSVTLEKKDPSNEANLLFIQNLDAMGLLDEAMPFCLNPDAPEGVEKEYAVDFICDNSSWTTSYRLNISSSFGSSVQLYRRTDNRWLNFTTGSATKYQINAIDSIRVTSQSRMVTTTYEFNVYDKLLSSFDFIKGNGKEFYPPLNGTVDLGAKTVTFNMSKTAYASEFEKLVAEWTTGAAKVKLDGVDIQSGVTELNFKPAATDTQVKKTLTFIVGYSSFNIDVVINLTN